MFTLHDLVFFVQLVWSYGWLILLTAGRFCPLPCILNMNYKVIQLVNQTSSFTFTVTRPGNKLKVHLNLHLDLPLWLLAFIVLGGVTLWLIFAPTFSPYHDLYLYLGMGFLPIVISISISIWVWVWTNRITYMMCSTWWNSIHMHNIMWWS